MQISKLILTPRKRKRETQDQNDNEQMKPLRRRSKRIRFMPLKYWEGQALVTDPKHILTMKDIEEKGDSLLSLPKRKDKTNGNTNNREMDDEEEYKCDEWIEYKNDDYYAPDKFDGNAWVYDEDDNPHNLIQRRCVSLPNNVQMNKSNNIYGGSIMQCKHFSSGFVEIPPKSQLTKELATRTAAFFVHCAQDKCLQFTLFTKEEQPTIFYLSEADMFYVPKDHYYELRNLSSKKIQLTVTQFL
eukprot:730305_1